mmetsp:Transcript_1591/g.2273  ORF Transcript_1591/g.2273 Transcript_1591/m.2273 type:complete len:98 (+) Transcript_1591:764-1057(+)
MLKSNAMIVILLNQMTAVGIMETATPLLNPVNVMKIILANVASSKVLARRWLCKTHFMDELNMDTKNLSICSNLAIDQSWFTTGQYTSKNYRMGILL